MKKWLGLALLCCSTVQADMLEALQAYEQKNYAGAQQQFAELLPLGNELAAFNLGVMAYQAQGQQQDLEKALAYFTLAAKLGHSDAAKVLGELLPNVAPQQLDNATLQYQQLLQQVKISAFNPDEQKKQSDVQPLKRIEPKYPIEAARKGIFGYVTLRFLIDEAGKVVVVDTVDAYPEHVFEKTAVAAIKKWQYEPSGAKHLMQVQLSYTLGSGINTAAAARTLQQHQLLDYALAGSPQHQLMLGTFIALIENQSGNIYSYETEPAELSFDMSLFRQRSQVRPDFQGFWGAATVRVDTDGVIVQQLDVKLEEKSEVKDLLGLRLRGNIDNDMYQLVRSSANRSRDIYVAASVRLPRHYSAVFWWELAAKNGNSQAQRIMAAYSNDWERYLLAQQDGEVMAWAGTRLILEGQREQGMQLLEQAIAKNYAPAKEMKQQFM